jgi:hypothetical protein
MIGLAGGLSAAGKTLLACVDHPRRSALASAARKINDDRQSVVDVYVNVIVV